MVRKILLLGLTVAAGYAIYSSRIERAPTHVQSGFFFEQSAKVAEKTIELGHLMRKKFNAGRPAAPGYAVHPYDLRVEIEQTEQGDIAYLVDRVDGSRQPIYKRNRVGCTTLELRRGLEKVVDGLLEHTRKSIREILDAIEPGEEARQNGT